MANEDYSVRLRYKDQARSREDFDELREIARRYDPSFKDITQTLGTVQVVFTNSLARKSFYQVILTGINGSSRFDGLALRVFDFAEGQFIDPANSKSN